MSFDIALVLALLGSTLVLFNLSWLSVDVVALVMVAALVLFGILTPQEAFGSFASEVIIVLASVFVLSGALLRSGVLEGLERALRRLAGHTENRLVAALMGVAAAASSVLSNTTATAVLMPSVLAMSRREDTSPSQLLMPLAYASMLGGTCTLFGTSTNLAANGLFLRLGLAPIGLFELARVGLVLVVLGILYMVFLGRRMLPQTSPSMAARYEVGSYLSQLTVGEESPLAGRSLQQVDLSRREIQVLAILRGSRRIAAGPRLRFQAGDVLLVYASREALLDLTKEGLTLTEASATPDEAQLGAEGVKLAEAILLPQSILAERTLRELRFRQRFGVSVLAVHRRGRRYPTVIADLRLQVGDVVLLEGDPEQLQVLQGNHDLWLLGDVVSPTLLRRRGFVALAALLVAVVVSGLGWVPLSLALLIAALVAVLTRCITTEEVYRLIEWRLVILIGGMTAFGAAIEQSGAAAYLAGWIVASIAPLGVYPVLAAFIVLTMALTQPLSNAAAALVVLPVAVATAPAVGAEPRAFAIIVTLAASLSFITPFEPACLLVYGPGGYQFRDFVRVGLPLTLIVCTVLLVVAPWLWPLVV